jgi:hypothetical protein
MTHARIAMLGVLVFAMSAGAALILLGHLKAKAPLAQQPVAEEAIGESVHAKPEQGQPPALEEAQPSPSRIQVAEADADSLRRAFLACFGHPPPRDPLLLTATERMDLWLSISAANGASASVAHERCRAQSDGREP